MSKKEKKILIVDDNPVTQKMFEKLLKNDGFDVYAAFDGKECLGKVKEVMPSIILMDVILPDADGKKIAVQLKQDPVTENIPIVFTTNTLNLHEDNGKQLFEVNGKKYRVFAKPIHQRKLLSAIHKEINRSIHGGKLPGGDE